MYLSTHVQYYLFHIAFFNTGAYQDALSGHGGIKHCLVPSPKHIVLNLDEHGNINHSTFTEEQKPEDVLKILGYYKD